MDILKLIKNRTTIRKYQNKPIPKKILHKIIEAGVWGPSLLAVGFQPWKFKIITNKKIIHKIATILLKKSERIGIGGNIILRTGSNTISNANTIIVVYNCAPVTKFVTNFRKIYHRAAKLAELSAISASIQNMILVAHSLGIGSCWLDAPLFCEKEISKLLAESNDKLVAILTLGYPAQKTKRSVRKPWKEIVNFAK